MSTQDLEQFRFHAGSDDDGTLLMIPGPTLVPPRVREAVSRQMISHRSPAFEELHADVTGRLARLLHTSGDVVIVPSSGTGALEAALVNIASPGDKVLSCIMGAFGERFCEIAMAYGLDVEQVPIEWGRAPTPDQIVERIQQADRPFHAVMLTHCETSTGVLLPLPEIAAAIRAAAPDVLIVVDMVSSFAGTLVDMDAWDIDVAVTASQKALMTPPGLGIVALGTARAQAAQAAARLPRYTWDFTPYLETPGKPPYTPAVGLWFGVQAALASIEEEGETALYARHRQMATMARDGFAALGITPLAPADVASPTVTGGILPEGLVPGTILRLLRERYGLVMAGGQGHLKTKIIRMGHMGGVQPHHVEAALGSLRDLWAELPSLGVDR